MIMNLEEFTVLLPLLILILTATIVMLSIAFQRNHFFVSALSISGLIISFFSLFLVNKVIPQYITALFYITRYSVLYISMILLSSITTCIFAYSWLSKYQFNKEEFYLLILISTLGSIGLTISHHMSSLFVNIEIISFPIFGLIFYSHKYKYSLESSLKYIILSSISSSFLLLGIAWIYSVSGSLNFSSISQILNIVSYNSEKLVVLFGLCMIFLSLFFKLSIFPFHLWIADIYQGTPALVLSFFSNAAKISIIALLFNFFPYILFENNTILYEIICLMIFLSIIFGNLMAIMQNNIKRLFGYTSISQLGYMLITLLTLRYNYLFSLETISIYLISYFFSNICFFGIINIISNPNNSNDVDIMPAYQGLFWRQPILAVIMTIVCLSLAGVPITLGFIGKFYILSIIIQNHLWFLGMAFFIGGVLGFYCYLRIIINLYLNPLQLSGNNISISTRWIYTFSGIIILFSGIMLLILGIFPNILINLVKLFIYF
ncbi:NADH-quinone oxidoreductase subunit N [Buchnera aphidicola]|uniref:NADH-quinone oxidoreductase subunit N n=1 Tax=Buchnera aphidicola TaxID=9 RepID=UPI003BEF4952